MNEKLINNGTESPKNSPPAEEARAKIPVVESSGKLDWKGSGLRTINLCLLLVFIVGITLFADYFVSNLTLTVR